MSKLMDCHDLHRESVRMGAVSWLLLDFFLVAYASYKLVGDQSAWRVLWAALCVGLLAVQVRRAWITERSLARMCPCGESDSDVEDQPAAQP